MAGVNKAVSTSLLQQRVGLIRGKEIESTPEPEIPPERMSTPRPNKRVRLEQFSSYEVTPVTAKHTLALEDEGDTYDYTRIEFPGYPSLKINMPDGGCRITEYIQVRPAREGVKAKHTDDNNYSFGKMITTPPYCAGRQNIVLDGNLGGNGRLKSSSCWITAISFP